MDLKENVNSIVDNIIQILEKNKNIVLDIETNDYGSNYIYTITVHPLASQKIFFSEKALKIRDNVADRHLVLQLPIYTEEHANKLLTAFIKRENVEAEKKLVTDIEYFKEGLERLANEK